jgi:putative transposase
MPQYLRAFIPGGTFFFTVTLLERRRKLLTEPIDTTSQSIGSTGFPACAGAG